MVRRPKLNQEEVDRILQMLQSGHSKTEAAQALGISRNAVTSIVSGAHRLSPYHKKEPKLVSEYRRCPECGAKVLMPCMACLMSRGEPVEKYPKVIIPSAF